MKRSVLFLVSLLVVTTMVAAPVSQQRAMQVAQQFIPLPDDQTQAPGLRAEEQPANIVYTHPMPKSGRPAFYVVNVGGSFVIVSADDVAHQVLGYNLGKNWPVAANGEVQIPPQVKGFFDDLAAQMEAAIEANPNHASDAEWSQPQSAPQRRMISEMPDSVGPLLTTTWDQGQFYNALCPEDQNSPYDGHCPTGCVATAMAQIINYWGYPIHGRGIHSYETNYGTLEVNYDSAHYDFAHMPAQLTNTSTPQEVQAVATLMRDCGVAANMGYSSGESSASDLNARAGLINFFRLRPNLSLVQRVHFNDIQWDSLLHTNIDMACPVFYCGEGVGVHAFVLDGYKRDGFYHFNFGWSGYADGWYLANSVTPGSYDFNNGQTAIMDIIPDSMSNIVLHQVQGTSTYIVDSPMELYHLQGHNPMDIIELSSAGIGGKTCFIPSDSTAQQIIIDILSFDANDAYLYDGLTTDSLLAYLSPGSAILKNSIVSSRNAVTVFSTAQSIEGFHLAVSKENGCRVVSGINTSSDTTLQITWNRNGSDFWEIEYGLQGFTLGEGNHLSSDTNWVEISNLAQPFIYDFYVRPICSNLWRKETIMVGTYWGDNLTEVPDGYNIYNDSIIKISSANGLAWWAKTNDDDGENNTRTNHIIIESDIDLSGKLWRPVNYYNGIIDGQGHVIRNMKIYEPQDGGALIHSIGESSIIKNLGFENYDIRCYYSVAGLANLCYGLILNCHASNGYMESREGECGGLVGSLCGTMYNCYSNNIIAKASGYTSGLVRDVSGGKIQNCYAFFENINTGWTLVASVVAMANEAEVSNCYGGKIHHINGRGVVGFVHTVSDIIDTSTVDVFNGKLMLVDSIRIDTTYYSDLLTVLNTIVETTGDSTWKRWVINDSSIYPTFGEYKIQECPSTTIKSIKNEIFEDEYCVRIMIDSTASDYEIKYVLADSSNAVPVYFHTSDTNIVLTGLELGKSYRFYARAICDSMVHGNWSRPKKHVFDKPYWHDIVLTEPSGYIVQDSNIYISSAEGLAWLAHVNARNCKIYLVQDIDMGSYKWKPISHLESCEIDGHNRSVRNLNSEGGLFGQLVASTVKNLIIEGSSTQSSENGALFGIAFGVNVINCHLDVNVYSVDIGSGALGGVAHNSNFINCSSSGIVVGNHQCGGLLGYVNGCTIENSFSNCLVKVQDSTIYTDWRGGLIGYVCEGSIVKNSYSCGQVPWAGWTTIAATIGMAESATIQYTYGCINAYSSPYTSVVDVFFRDPFIEYPEESYNNNSIFLQNGILQNPVTIDNSSYTDLLSALNAWVDANNEDSIYCHWVADTAMVNGGFPIFAPMPVEPVGPATEIDKYKGTNLPARKVFERGQLYIILPDGTRYDATGKKVK